MAGGIPDDWFRPDADEARVRPPVEPAPPQERQPAEVTTQTSMPAYPRRPPAGCQPGRRNRVLAVIAIVSALVLGMFAGQAFRQSSNGQQQPRTTASATEATQATPFSGRVRSIAPTAVEASCTAKNATDSLGATVSYAPTLVLDNRLDTAWRCDGDGLGQTLAFTLPEGTVLARVGVFNGYGKRDPKTGDLMYGQYRRVTSVAWSLPDGTSFTQSFADNGSGIQLLDLPATTVAGTVTLTITSSTAPGWTNVGTRNAVLLSEVQFFEVAP